MIYILVNHQPSGMEIISCDKDCDKLECLKDRLKCQDINPHIIPLECGTFQDGEQPIYWDVSFYKDEDLRPYVNFYFTPVHGTKVIIQNDEEWFSWYGSAWSAEDAIKMAMEALNNTQ
jgi:hypothetical protein